MPAAVRRGDHAGLGRCATRRRAGRPHGAAGSDHQRRERRRTRRAAFRRRTRLPQRALRLSSGIGAGAICDGRMLLGHDGAAGELGHVVVEPQGALCRCGNRGCLETVASPPAIADLLTRSWGRPVATTDLPGLLRAADRGTARVVEDAGEAVGRALAVAVMMLNPEMIVVGGELAAARETLFDPMRRTLNRNTMVCHGRSLRIVPSALATARGCAGPRRSCSRARRSPSPWPRQADPEERLDTASPRPPAVTVLQVSPRAQRDRRLPGREGIRPGHEPPP
jgi:hypothetical protein